MNYEVIDFKTVSVNYKLDTGIGSELGLRAESRVSVKTPDEWCGFVYLYLNTKIHDENDTYFVFDITTETVIKIPDEISEMSEELMQELIPLAQQRSYAAIRDMSLAMGINELDLSK